MTPFGKPVVSELIQRRVIQRVIATLNSYRIGPCFSLMLYPLMQAAIL
jgi:hypothetical protein